MKRILFSSFFIAFGIVAMAQVKPAAKQTVPAKKVNTEAAQKALAAHIAWKNEMVNDAAKRKAVENARKQERTTTDAPNR